jgi:hypothetical protein
MRVLHRSRRRHLSARTEGGARGRDRLEGPVAGDVVGVHVRANDLAAQQMRPTRSFRGPSGVSGARGGARARGTARATLHDRHRPHTRGPPPNTRAPPRLCLPTHQAERRAAPGPRCPGRPRRVPERRPCPLVPGISR